MSNNTNALINDGAPTAVWHGITAAHLLRRCQQATTEESAAMGYVASLIHAGEPIAHDEWAAAERACHAVEARLVATWAAPVRLNRHGQPWGGMHPALA